ncbi:leucine-rich repeat domain-containing protein [Flavobacterium oreochromis]|uniref:leucine-rich repeat domain-containing protein n=1 Tax=Flavobacterium oreochromis TaxID=2906078 RepID=UPI00385C2FC1
MHPLIKYLEKEIYFEIIESKEDLMFQSTYKTDQQGNIIALYLRGSQEKDIKINNFELLLPLAENLKELSISSCEISKIDNIGKFQKLEYLDLSFNPISDFKEIKKLINLKRLELYGTNLNINSSLDFLQSLENLEHLNIGYTELTSIQGIENLNKLKTLILRDSKIKSFKDLPKMPNVTYLDLYNSDLFYDSGLESLAVFENLKALNLSGCPILTTQGLGKLTRLEQLFLEDTRVEEVVSLESLKNLKLLSLSNTHLYTIQGLEGLENLRLINLAHNDVITEIECLQGLKNVEIIHLGYTGITAVKKEHFKGIEKDCIVNFSCEDKLNFIDKELPSNITIAFEFRKYGNYTPYNEDVDQFIDKSKARLIEHIKGQEISS